ncbi:DUF3025 domain-containing protein [Curvibacter sp. CHRR-16]|nr:DUF3025 domain-containing protein [Curvibacter sp. CHRR-16]
MNRVNWSAPWLAHLCPLGPLLTQRVLAGASVADALNHGLLLRQRQGSADAPAGAWQDLLDGRLHFVPQQDLPSGMAYEAHIATTGAVPTRDNLHDFFNGLIWLHYPQTKARITALHWEQIGLQTRHAPDNASPPRRGAVRDGLTLLDENGALLLAPPAVVAALQAKDWMQLFGPLRPAWQRSRVCIVGHALLEQLVLPRKPLTAHVLAWSMDAIDLIAASADWTCSTALNASWVASKPFAHLPVLGVPGWWPANGGLEQGDAAFYADASVFRRPRSPSTVVPAPVA